MNTLGKIQTGVITLMLLFTASGTACAQDDINRPDIKNLLYTFTTEGDDVTTTDYIASLPNAEPGLVLGQITYYALVVANILAFLSFLASGIFMVISQGNDEQLGKAKSMLMYTVMAMVICAVALAVVTGITRLQFFNP